MVITSNWLSAAIEALKEPEVVWPEVDVDHDFDVAKVLVQSQRVHGLRSTRRVVVA